MLGNCFSFANCRRFNWCGCIMPGAKGVLGFEIFPGGLYNVSTVLYNIWGYSRVGVVDSEMSCTMSMYSPGSQYHTITG